jgi:hypothetical protein
VKGYFRQKGKSQREKEIEDRLNNEFESPANQILPHLVSPLFPSTVLQRKVLSRYIWTLFTRSRARRTGSETKVREYMASVAKAAEDNSDGVFNYAAYLSMRSGRPFVIDDVKQALLNVTAPDSQSDNSDTLFIDTLFSTVDRFEDAALKKQWAILVAPESYPFILSDAMVITRVRTTDGAYGYGWGFTRPGVQIVFSASPSCCLIIGDDIPGRRQASREEIDEVNLSMIKFAVERVYAQIHLNHIEIAVNSFLGHHKIGIDTFKPNSTGARSEEPFDLLFN